MSHTNVQLADVTDVTVEHEYLQSGSDSCEAEDPLFAHHTNDDSDQSKSTGGSFSTSKYVLDVLEKIDKSIAINHLRVCVEPSDHDKGIKRVHQDENLV